MGVLNLTPDSFSDGGAFESAADALAAGRRLFDSGADIVDVGGESTRPGAAPVTPEIEQSRILPVIHGLARYGLVSVDTRHATTMDAALRAGARIVNDVSGLSHDPSAAAVVAGADCPVILMHMRGTPQTMARLTSYDDVVTDVVDSLMERVQAAEAAGVSRNNIAIDPGLGFAKTAKQSTVILARLPELCALQFPVVVGASRKSFIGGIGDAPNPRDRDPGSLAAHLWAAWHGATVIRTHDVAATVQALSILQALRVEAAASVGFPTSADAGNVA
jgi:dihydropteroate synthase